MADDRQFYGAHGIGKRDAESGRYIPIGGGSRSRLVQATGGVRPYRGFAGVDNIEQVRIDSITSLYQQLEKNLDKLQQSDLYRERDAAIAAMSQQETPLQEPVAEPALAEPAWEEPEATEAELADESGALVEEVLVEGEEIAEGQPREATPGDSSERIPDEDSLNNFEL